MRRGLVCGRGSGLRLLHNTRCSKSEARILALVPGAYGAHGGIARYNRDLFYAISNLSTVGEIVVLPRLVDQIVNDQMPSGVRQLPAPCNRWAFALKAFNVAFRELGFDLVFCGHLNLVALAARIARHTKAKLWLQVHGIEAWQQTPPHIERAATASDLVTSVSRFTRTRILQQWWWIDPARIRVLPNTLDAAFVPAPKSETLIERYQLQHKRVILTVSRLVSSEAYKGHDRVISALPRLRKQFPDLVYLIVGEGDDQVRLKQLAKNLGQENAPAPDL